jgi:hypothetical protein
LSDAVERRLESSGVNVRKEQRAESSEVEKFVEVHKALLDSKRLYPYSVENDR